MMFFWKKFLMPTFTIIGAGDILVQTMLFLVHHVTLR